jgi:hypothetical protein
MVPWGLSGAPLLGRLLASPTTIRLGWKGLPGTNTLAYYGNPQITAAKNFIVQAPGLLSTIKFSSNRMADLIILCKKLMF